MSLPERLAAHARDLDASGHDSTASGAVSSHASDTTGIHGIADTSVLATATDVSSAVSSHAGAADPHTGYQKESEKGNANGYASLDGSGLVPDTQIPSGIARDSEVTSAVSALSSVYQPLDSDLTAIAGLSPSNDDVVQRKAGAWTNRTLAQLIADLAALGTTFQPLDSDLTSIAALATTAFGRGLLTLADAAALLAAAGASASGHDHGGTYQPADADLTSIAAITTTAFGRGLLALADAAALLAAAGAQAADSDLTAVAGLTPTNDDLIQRKAGAWTNRTMAQLLTDLAALGTTFQPLDATLTALAAANWAANAVPIGTGADTLSQTAFAANTFPARASTGNLVAKAITDAALNLLDDADAAAMRTTLSAVGTARAINNGFGISGGGDLSADRTLAVALTNSQTFATATTSVSAATYADVTGLSASLAAGTWLLIARVVGSSVNAQAIMNCAITDNANAIIAEGSQGIGASGTASVAQLATCPVFAIVSPGSTTTYKVRAARGNTTITGTWTAMDGAGTGTTNNLTDNSDKGSSLIAVRIA